MWEYYEQKTILVTGGSGFLGTALIHRLLTAAAPAKLYVLCRGDQSLESKWARYLGPKHASRMAAQVSAVKGDITKQRLGIQDQWEEICNSTHIIIHAASSINLAQPFERLYTPIVDASQQVADLALACRYLQSFVYVSTAFCNTHLRRTAGDTGVTVEEKLYHENGTGNIPGPAEFPWGYAYAKFVTEGILTRIFKDRPVRLLIIRPSIIGPAQSFPEAGFCCPLSTPRATVAAALALTLSRSIRLPTDLLNAHQEAQLDEVPVDVVVDRLLMHLAFGTHGPVHAVSGSARVPFRTWWNQVSSFRRLPWDVRPRWVPWDCPNVHWIGRLFKVLGTNYNFIENATKAIASVGVPPGVQLNTDASYHARRPVKEAHVWECVQHFTRRETVLKTLANFMYPPSEGVLLRRRGAIPHILFINNFLEAWLWKFQDIREALELINNTMEDTACGVGVKILNGIEAKRNRHAPVDQFASVIKQAMKEGRWSPGSNRKC